MLYHFSEEPGIKRFVPRENQNREGLPPVVWAIDEEHQFTYFFPRNCPRIVVRATPDMSEEERDRFFGQSLANAIITIESRWYARVADCTIYRCCQAVTYLHFSMNQLFWQASRESIITS
ncbi:DUF6886 family protein [Paenibacillus thiaminolyticus]|uniref:DUF6886 family protein n=1 Tax=Paenibacillus thiaminolyticus TaxID=49283 RepID=UPI0016004637|nr:DUF6886 family protein [Paenibacillus thiaminolyticus]